MPLLHHGSTAHPVTHQVDSGIIEVIERADPATGRADILVSINVRFLHAAVGQGRSWDNGEEEYLRGLQEDECAYVGAYGVCEKMPYQDAAWDAGHRGSSEGKAQK
jgi:hypothetical protein